MSIEREQEELCDGLVFRAYQDYLKRIQSSKSPLTQTATMPGDRLLPVSVETMTRAMQEIGLLPKPDQWIVIDPQGRVHTGNIEDVTRVLLAEHPLLKIPPTFPLGR